MESPIELTEVIQPAENSKPIRLGGWLIVAAFGFVIQGGILLMSLVLWVSHADVVIGLFSGNEAAQIYGIRAVLGLIVFCVELIFCSIAGTRFFRKKRSAPRTIIIFTEIGVFMTLILVAIDSSLASHDSIAATGKFIIGGLQSLPALIWISYFSSSKRVKATFIY